MPLPAPCGNAGGDSGFTPKEILEETLTVLHQSMEQARNTLEKGLTSPRTKNNRSRSTKIADKVPDSPSSWLLGMFHQREKEHFAEKISLKNHLKSEKQKKHTYKDQLKDALRDQITLLEEQVQSGGPHSGGDLPAALSSSEDRTAAKSVDSDVTPAQTLTTHGSSTASDEVDPRPKRRTISSPKQSDDGFEISFKYDNGDKVRQLECQLQETIQQFDRERAEWLKTLENVTLVNIQGSELSAQQEQQIRDLEHRMSENQLNQLEEKNAVLKELLSLTEQQQQSERNEWEEEIRSFDAAVSMLSSDKAALIAKAKVTEKELADAKATIEGHQKMFEKFSEAGKTEKALADAIAKIEDLSIVQEEQKKVYEKTVSELRQLREESKREKETSEERATQLKKLNIAQEEWNREKEIFENTVTQLVADKAGMRKQITKLRKNLQLATDRSGWRSRSSPNRKPSEMEDNLDRATAERDMYHQETKQLEKDRRELLKDLGNAVAEKRQAEELLEKERKDLKEILAAKDRELEQVANKLEETLDSKEKEIERVKTLEVTLAAKEKDIEKAAKELEETLASKEKEIDQAAKELEEILADKEKEIDQAAKELEGLRAEMERALGRATGLGEALSEKDNEIVNALESILAEKDMEIEQAKTVLESERKQLLAEFEAKQMNLKAETERQIQELKLKHSAELQQQQQQQHLLPESDLTEKYKESVTKRNDLIYRIRKMEQQRGEEKCDWKLRLEGALAESRKWSTAAKQLKAKLEQQAKHNEEVVKDLQKKLDEQSVLLSEMANTKSQSSTKDNRELQLAVAKKDAEYKLALVQEQHAKELQIKTTKLENLMAEREKSDNELQRCKENAIKELQLKNAELETLKADKEAKVDELRRYKEKSSKELQLRTSELENLKAELESLKADKETKVDELRRYKEKANKELQLKTSELESLKAEKNKSSNGLQRYKENGVKLASARAETRIQKESMNGMKQRLKEVWELKGKRENELDECRSILEQKKSEISDLAQQVNELESRLEVASDLNEKLTKEIEEKNNLVTDAQEEARVLAVRSHDLSKQLQDLKTHQDYTMNKLEAQEEDLESETDQLKHSGESFAQGRARAVEVGTRDSINNHRDVIYEAVEELRKDVISIRETIISSSTSEEAIEKANFSIIRDDLGQLQATLDDVVAELTLETEAMYETRNAVKAISNGQSPAGEQGTSVFLKQQEVLFSQIEKMNDNIKKLSEGERGGEDAIRLQLVAELQRKEAALVQCTTDLEALKKLMSAEIGMREKAEAEIKTLNDQADSYTDEIMNLQSENERLEVTLKEAERKLMSALGGGYAADDIDSVLAYKERKTFNDESPLLDDALALAESLSEIVQGNGEDGKETSVLQMLETLSEKMDQHDRNRMSRTSFSGSERGNLAKCISSPAPLDEVQDEYPPLPVSTPIGSTPIGVDVPADAGSALQMLVEQLHGRCQLLERERLEMMEVTLDLLEAARQSSKAELNAALATARRNATEDMLRMNEAIHKDKEKIYHRLCNQCIRGLGIHPCHSLES